jgi:lipopolysaccharide assembly protein A
MQIFLIVSLIIAVIAVLFAVQNAAPVGVQFLFWKYQAPLALSLLLSVLLGVLISLLFSIPSMTRSRLTIRNQRKKISELESGLNDTKLKLAEAQTQTAELEKKLTEVKDAPPIKEE